MIDRARVIVLTLLTAACTGSPESPTIPTPATQPAPTASQRFTLSGTVFETTAGTVRSIAGLGVHRFLEFPGGNTGDSGWGTDAQGRYVITDLPPGSRVSVGVLGAWLQPCAAVAMMTEDTVLDIELVRGAGRVTSRPPALLSGTVYEATPSGRRPAAGKIVSFFSNCRGLNLAQSITDSAGRYELCRLPRGAACVSILTSFDGDETEKRVEILDDTQLDIDLEPVPGANFFTDGSLARHWIDLSRSR